MKRANRGPDSTDPRMVSTQLSEPSLVFVRLIAQAVARRIHRDTAERQAGQNEPTNVPNTSFENLE